MANRWFTEHRASFKALSDERRSVYDDLRAMADQPQPLTILRPTVRSEATLTIEGDIVEQRERHLLSDADGRYPIGELNEWEVRVVDHELARADSVAWYRNPSRASADSIAIAYQDATGNLRRLCPDFVFFARVGSSVKPYIVDPHGHHLADALPKLRGLARYAAEHVDHFHRIEAVAVVDGTLRVLDLTDPKVRDAVEATADAETLYRSDAAADY